jgi:hypothetical protein
VGQVRGDWLCREFRLQRDGVMEYWNVGILGLAEVDLFYYGWHRAENKIRPSSAFGPQYSIFPPFHHSIGSLKVNSTPLG